MKTLLLSALLVIAGLRAYAQRAEINNHNYYSYFTGYTSMQGGLTGPVDKLKSRKLGTNWLRWEDVTPVLVEEMQKAGYEYVLANQLYRLDSARYVVLAAYSLTSNVGFVYAQGHAAFPQAADRQPGNLLADKGKYVYTQTVSTQAGKIERVGIRVLPANILLLAENWYWYQYTENAGDNKYLLTKEDILRVLRQDIQEKLATAPKPVRR